ncbi:hypothetical protein SARC_16959, partial [Sphaeroforma arctica JP610]
FRFTTDSPRPKSSDIGVAYPPGKVGFSGGSGFAITRVSNCPMNAWDFVRNATSTESAVMSLVNFALEKAPPYKSVWLRAPWNSDTWKPYIWTFDNGGWHA